MRTSLPSRPSRALRAGVALALAAGATSVLTMSSAEADPAQADPAHRISASDIKVNEINSSGTDFIELTNVGPDPVDVSGWNLADNSDKRFLVPTTAAIPAGGFVSFAVDDATNPLGGFGLGNGDSARVFLADGTTLVDEHAYPAHGVPSWGRCPDGTGAFVQTTALTPGAANACPSSFDPLDVQLNEVESNGDTVGDWVEVTNTGDAPADISGWKLIDADATHPFVTVPAGTVLAPGSFFALYTEFPPPGFGLGAEDTVTLYEADGTSLVDTFSWTGGHASTTYGRCPDGTGPWQVTTVPTRGAANACSPIRLNEVSSDPNPDWVELVNLSSMPVDVAGWVVKDSTDTNPTTLPRPSVVPAGGHLLVSSLAAGLGSADAVRLFDPSAALIDSWSWTAHGVPTYARCADGVGAFTASAAPTPGAVNDCPGLQTEPWWGSPTVTVSDEAATFPADASGVSFDPADASGRTLWVAQNKVGTLWKLRKDSTTGTWQPASGWAGGRNPRYADGTGAPDTEGVALGPDGAVFLAAERNNDVSGVSRNTILRYQPTVSMSAADEWDLNPLLPALGANLGLEGVTFVPDGVLTAGHFVDQSTGAPYDPTDYPGHGSSLAVVAVEGTGRLYAVALEQTAAVDETAHLIATIDPELLTNAGPAAAMDVSWDPEGQVLRALCDDSCDGTTVALALNASGAFAVTRAYDRPVGMPNLNNEGLALAPQSSCLAGGKEVVWSDDGDTDGHSLRSGTVPCTMPPVEPTPTPTPTPTAMPIPTPTPTAVSSVKIRKSTRGRIVAQVRRPTRVVLRVDTSAGSPTGEVRVRLSGVGRSLTARLRSDGRLVLRLPALRRVGRRTLTVVYLGDEVHPRSVARFAVSVRRSHR